MAFYGKKEELLHVRPFIGVFEVECASSSFRESAQEKSEIFVAIHHY